MPIRRTVGCLTLASFLLVTAGQVLAQETGTLRGSVVDEDGNVVARAQVAVRPFNGASDGLDLEAAADGTFGVFDLPAGLYTVTAGTDELGSELFRVRLRPGREVAVHFRLALGRRDASWLTELSNREAASRTFAAGLTSIRAGNHQEAIEQFVRAIERQPECSTCHYNLAVAYVGLERFDDAEVAFKRVLELTPDLAAAYYGLASVHTRQGRTAEAEAARGEATRLALANLAERGQRLRDTLEQGIATLNAGNLAGARASFENLVRQDSGFTPSYYWLGVTLRDSHDPDGAARAFRRYLQLDGGGDHAAQALEALASLGRDR